MNQEIDWFHRSRQWTISQNRVAMGPFTNDYRRGFRGRDDCNTYGGSGNNQYNQGHRNNNRHSQQQTANSYSSGPYRDLTSYGSVRPISGFSGSAEPTGAQGYIANNFSREPSASSTPILPAAPAFKSVGHGPAPLPPIANLDIHTSHQLSPGFPLDARVPPPPIGQLDLARPPPAVSGWYQNGIEYPGAPFLPPQPALSSRGASLSRPTDSQQILNERSHRWPNNKHISPALDVKSTVSDRSVASRSESIPASISSVKEEVDDDDDVICVTDLNAKSKSPPLDTFIRFLDANYSGLFQIINRVSGNDWLPTMETFLQNLEDELFQIDDKIRLWMHLNMVMISATQGISFVNIELDNHLDLMERFFEIYFNLMKQIFQQAWKLRQVPDCKDIAVNCILVLSRCFCNRYDRILNCFLERQIPMDVKGLPQVWFQVLSYLLTVPVHNFLEEDGYRIYLIWQKFRALCETTRLVQKMDKVVNRRLSETRSIKGNFYIQDILKKQDADKAYNWWDMIQDYFKYMEGKKRTALESYNYSYMYPGNPDSPSTSYIAPARISHNFKPFYESLFAWSRDDEMARLFDRVETDFNIAEREMKNGYKFPEIDLTVRPDYVDPNFVPPKPKPTNHRARRALTQRQVTSNKIKMLRSLSTIVISDSDSEDDDNLPASHSSRCNTLNGVVPPVVLEKNDPKEKSSGLADEHNLEKNKSYEQPTLLNNSSTQETCNISDESSPGFLEEQSGALIGSPVEIDKQDVTAPGNSAVNDGISHKPNGNVCNEPDTCVHEETLLNSTSDLPKPSSVEVNSLEDHLSTKQDTSDQKINSNEIKSSQSGVNILCVSEVQMETSMDCNVNESNDNVAIRSDSCDLETSSKNALNTVATNDPEVRDDIAGKTHSDDSTVLNITHTESSITVPMPSVDEHQSSEHFETSVSQVSHLEPSSDSHEVDFTRPPIVGENQQELCNNSMQETSDYAYDCGQEPCTEDNTSRDGCVLSDECPQKMNSDVNLECIKQDRKESNQSRTQKTSNYDGSVDTIRSNVTCLPKTSNEGDLQSEVNSDDLGDTESSLLASDSDAEDGDNLPVSHSIRCNTLNGVVQPVILAKNDPKEYNSSDLAEEHNLEKNKSYEQPTLLNNGSTQETCNISDESSPGFLEEQSGALIGSPVEIDKQDVTAPGNSAVNDGISHKPNGNVCNEPDTCVHEETLLNSTSDLPKPSSVEVNSWDGHLSNKQETSDQKINSNEIKSSMSDVNIPFVSEAPMQTSMDCNVNELNDKVAIRSESCDLEASKKYALDTVAINDLVSEVRPNIAGKTHSDDSTVLKMTHTESSMTVPMLSVTDYQSVGVNQQKLCINSIREASYYACAYDQEQCTKDNTGRDGSALSDERPQEMNLEYIKQNRKRSKQSRKRKASYCDDTVDTKRRRETRNVISWPKPLNEGDVRFRVNSDDLSEKSSDASIEIASPPYETLDMDNVKSDFEARMKLQALAAWKYRELASSSLLTTADDMPSSAVGSSHYECPVDLSNTGRSRIDHHAEKCPDVPDKKLGSKKFRTCREVYESFSRAESDGGELAGGTYDQQQNAHKDGVKAKVVPRTSALTEQSYTGVNPEDSYRDISYRPGSKTVGFSKKSVLKYRSEEKKKVHFSVGEDEFQNGLEGPVGKPMRHSSEIISDFCWDDSQQPYSVSVKPVSQLKDVKLESISKKHKAINTQIDNTLLSDALIDGRLLYDMQQADVYSQSFINESSGGHLNDIGADPYLYFSNPILVEDGFKIPSPSEDFAMVGFDSLGVMKDSGLVMNFTPCKPAAIPLNYSLHGSASATSNELQVQRESEQEVKLTLPPKKRKLTDEEELNILLTLKYMEESEQSQKLQKSYPAERQMSIAEIQRDNPKFRTPAARKEYPTLPQVYQKYPDQCPDQYGNITNFFISGFAQISHKLNKHSDNELVITIEDSQGQYTAPQQTPCVEQSSATEATEPVLPPPRAKRGRNPSTVVKSPGVKRGRGRPRKNPL
uniref:Uncharacterized protein n=1 Tax=Dendroctonus ponderosae TaxID=77166 RepID=A0AAR5PG66_DENPD